MDSNRSMPWGSAACRSASTSPIWPGLVAQVTPDVFYTSGTSAGGTQLTLWLQEPAAKKALLANPTSGAVYYGIDLSPYPGDQVMQAWWNDSPFCYTGFYLGPTAYHSDTSFMSKRQTLVNQGWGLLPIYVGRQADSEHLDTPTGIADADEAVSLAVSNAFPLNTTIYLDVETGLPLTSRLPELCHILGQGGSRQGVWRRDILQHEKRRPDQERPSGRRILGGALRRRQSAVVHSQPGGHRSFLCRLVAVYRGQQPDLRRLSTSGGPGCIHLS